MVMGLFVVGLGLLAPVLIMPLFNKFTPLEDGELRAELLDLARQVDADISEIQVSDASRRTRKDNAFVAGMGKTRRLVLYDTLLPRPREQVRTVAAHEIGHWKRRHVVRIIPVIVLLLFTNFGVLRLVLGWDAALRWAGVEGIEDPAVLPLFLLVFPLASAVTGLVSAWVTRAGEREADLFALEVTRDDAATAAMLRALHTDNLADLTPSWWKRATSAHPPAAERLAMCAAWAEGDNART
jgi:STE24 endopeptidase